MPGGFFNGGCHRLRPSNHAGASPLRFWSKLSSLPVGDFSSGRGARPRLALWTCVPARLPARQLPSTGLLAHVHADRHVHSRLRGGAAVPHLEQVQSPTDRELFLLQHKNDQIITFKCVALAVTVKLSLVMC